MFEHFTESDRVQPDINLLLREEDNLSNIYLARYNMYNLDPNSKNMFTTRGSKCTPDCLTKKSMAFSRDQAPL